jgi:hypothetical protein
MEINENQEVQEQESSSLAEEFDASAFMVESDSMENTTETETMTNETKENETESTENQEVESTTEAADDEATDWGVDTEVAETTQDVEGSTTEEVSSESETTVSDSWKEIADKLGMDADNYDAFIETLERQKSLAQTGATNEKINGLNQLVELNDESLVRKELEARGFSPDEVEDELDIMIENNTIRSEARKVRKDLEGVIAAEREAIVSQSQAADATQQAEIDEAIGELQDYMSKTNEMFGGRINSQQKQDHVSYVSDNFFDEITADAQSMAEAAWLWKYRDQILKGMRTKGVEQGKAAVLDKMVNPEVTRKNAIPDPETGEFNPNRFMDSEQM